MHKVAVVVGSIASGSINKKLAKAIAKLASGRLDFHFVQIDDLPLYNYENDGNMAQSAKRLKSDIEAADAVLFVTPEYMRSIPGVLKNALDTASRPYGASSWHGKPTAVCGTSQGGVATAAAQQHLRTILSHTGAVTMPVPEVFVQTKPGMIDEDFSITDEATEGFLSGFVDKFVAWIEQQKK
jgi:chromate reductase, NAD(P)H dehydrogenase (quinone)